MARRGKYKPLAARNRSNMRLTPVQKEAVVHIYHTVGSVAKTAEELGIAQKTVERCLAEANTNPELAAARAHSMTDIAARINGVTGQIIDSIAPEEMQTVRVPVYTEKGALKDIRVVGPSLKEKALSIAILTDKQRVLTETIAQIKAPLHDGNRDQTLMLPGDLVEARRLVALKVKKLRLVDVEFDTGAAGKRINEALTKVGLDVDDAEYEKVVGEPFD